MSASQIMKSDRPLIALGGAYWLSTRFHLGPAYRCPNGTLLVGPFQVTTPFLTLRAAVEPNTNLSLDLWIYSPASLSPPYREAPAASSKPIPTLGTSTLQVQALPVHLGLGSDTPVSARPGSQPVPVY